jgi:hypothetical protein
MMPSRWFSRLQQPFPFTDGKGFLLNGALVSGLFVALFLYLFRPFGLQSASPGLALRLSLEFGLVTGSVGILWGAMIMLLPLVFREERWTVWKEILANLIFIGLVGAANLLYASWRFGDALSWEQFWLWQRITFLVGIFPTVYGVTLKQVRLLRRYTGEAAELNAHLHETHTVVADARMVVLEGDNQDERLSIQVDQLLYIAAADNYVQVFYREGGQLSNTLLRGTLKKMEEALTAYPQCFRCHRTYLVNLDHVVAVQGNAQGYKLQLAGADVLIPVSRALNDTIRGRLN